MTGEHQISEVGLNACRRPSVAGAGCWWLALQFVAMLLFAAPGCGSVSPPPEGRTTIENVAKWYQRYRTVNGKPPPNEEAFLGFIQSELESRGDTVDLDQMMTSPRDGQKYVIYFGKPTSRNLERSVAVYEEEGYNGKKLIAFELGHSQEVDEAELQSLLAGE